MKELDRKVSYDVRDLNENQLREFKKECIKQGATGVFNDAYNKDYNDLIRVNKISVSNSIFDGKWCIAKGFEDSINALTLFKPQFKQGDKVLVSYNEIDWHETEFVCYYKDYYYTINGRAKNIKPYEEEIKVGDWVKRISDETIWKIRDKEDVNVALNSECTKITNTQLIELLNNEL